MKKKVISFCLCLCILYIKLQFFCVCQATIPKIFFGRINVVGIQKKVPPAIFLSPKNTFFRPYIFHFLFFFLEKTWKTRKIEEWVWVKVLARVIKFFIGWSFFSVFVLFFSSHFSWFSHGKKNSKNSAPKKVHFPIKKEKKIVFLCTKSGG